MSGLMAETEVEAKTITERCLFLPDNLTAVLHYEASLIAKRLGKLYLAVFPHCKLNGESLKLIEQGATGYLKVLPPSYEAGRWFRRCILADDGGESLLGRFVLYESKERLQGGQVDEWRGGNNWGDNNCGDNNSGGNLRYKEAFNLIRARSFYLADMTIERRGGLITWRIGKKQWVKGTHNEKGQR